MATTSLWHIEGRLSDLIDYVENPDKTVPKGTEDFFNVFDYVRREGKTKDEYVTAINCLKQTALQQMILTKKQYGKNDKYIAWHGYQSFKVGEVSPETAHEIGVKLAREMWGDRFQIVVTTHLDKDHIHNHFAFNSVSFRDGRKYNYSKAEMKRLRETSDRLCIEHGLSVIENPHKAPSRPVWLDEKSGKPTRYNVYREDITDAMANSSSIADMEKYLQRLGYITDFSGKHWKIRLPQYQHYTRLDTLNGLWTPEYLEKNLGIPPQYRSEPADISYNPHMPFHHYSSYKPFVKTSYIYRLYLYFCYELGIYPKNNYYRPTSPFLKEELRKLDEYSNQAKYMAEHNIQTIDDLLEARSYIEDRLNELIDKRKHLQNKIRRATPEEKEKLRAEKSEVSSKIAGLRKHLKINHKIEERSVHIQETLDLMTENEARAKGKVIDKTACNEVQDKGRKQKERDDAR